MENCQLQSELAAIKKRNSMLKEERNITEDGLVELQEKYSALEPIAARQQDT